jgi:hypothetical protein
MTIQEHARRCAEEIREGDRYSPCHMAPIIEKHMRAVAVEVLDGLGAHFDNQARGCPAYPESSYGAGTAFCEAADFVRKAKAALTPEPPAEERP